MDLIDNSIKAQSTLISIQADYNEGDPIIIIQDNVMEWIKNLKKCNGVCFRVFLKIENLKIWVDLDGV